MLKHSSQLFSCLFKQFLRRLNVCLHNVYEYRSVSVSVNNFVPVMCRKAEYLFTGSVCIYLSTFFRSKRCEEVIRIREQNSSFQISIKGVYTHYFAVNERGEFCNEYFPSKRLFYMGRPRGRPKH